MGEFPRVADTALDQCENHTSLLPLIDPYRSETRPITCTQASIKDTNSHIQWQLTRGSVRLNCSPGDKKPRTSTSYGRTA